MRVRGREAGKPVLVLIADLAMAGMVAASVPSGVRRLAARFWPGPLTLVLPARDDAPAALTAGTGTVGVRVSSHPTAAALVAALGRPVTAPSVNPPGAPPARDVAEARAYFGDASLPTSTVVRPPVARRRWRWWKARRSGCSEPDG